MRRLSSTAVVGLSIAVSCSPLKPNERTPHQSGGAAGVPADSLPTTGGAPAGAAGEDAGAANEGAPLSGGAAGLYVGSDSGASSESGGHAGGNGESGARSDGAAAGGVPGAGGLPPDPDGLSGEGGAPISHAGVGGAAPPVVTHYVNALTGSDDTSHSTLATPYKTITRALEAAGGQSADIVVAPGLYDAALGERFPLILRGGIRLLGAGRETVLIEGAGEHFTEEASYEVARRVTLVVGDRARPSEVSGVSLGSGPRGSETIYEAVICDEGDALSTSPRAATRIAAIEVLPGYRNGILAGAADVLSGSACVLEMYDSVVGSVNWGVVASGCLFARPIGTPVRLDIRGNTFTHMWGREFDDGAGVLLQNCVDHSSIHSNVFENSVTGVWIDQRDLRQHVSRVRIEDNTFRELSWTGLLLFGSAPAVELFGNRFERISLAAGDSVVAGRIATAILIGDAEGGSPALRARSNRIRDNDSGVMLGAWFALSETEIAALDFGTEQDPGNNWFSCNARADPYDRLGGDVDIDVVGAGRLSFAGNYWDHAPPQTVFSGNGVHGADLIVWRAPEGGVGYELAALADDGCP